MEQFVFKDSVKINVEGAALVGEMAIPENAQGLVLFVQDNQDNNTAKSYEAITRKLQEEGFATLHYNLLTAEESQHYENHLDIPLMTDRVLNTVYWVQQDDVTKDFNLSLVGAGRGAAAAFGAAAALTDTVKAIVSVAGRSDLAAPVLMDVQAPSLLLVGGKDEPIISFNQEAHQQLQTIKDLQLVPDASSSFQEPGAAEHAAQLVTEWIKKYMEPDKLHPLRQE